MNDRPRLLFVGMTANPGGKESYMLHAFSVLRPDYECWFLTDVQQPAYAEQIEAQGGRIVRIRPRSRSPWGYLADIRRAIAPARFDVVWTHQTVINTLAPLNVAKRRRVPVRIIHSHSSRNMGTKVAAMLHPINKRLVRRVANRYFACSENAARWFYDDRPFTFIPNAFDITRFTFDPRRRDATRRELAVPEGALVIVHVARFGAEKNHPMVLAITRELARRGRTVRTLLVGDGSLRGQVEQQVHEQGLTEQVLFLGKRSDVPDLLSAGDLFVLPSTFEGLPYSVLEAEAAGLPCLVSDRVTTACDASGACRFLPIEDSAATWADAAEEMLRTHERPAGVNPLNGSMFDERTSREHLLRAIHGE